MFPFLIYRDESLPTCLDGTASQPVSIIRLFTVLMYYLLQIWFVP